MHLNQLKNVVLCAGAAALAVGCVSVVPVRNFENKPVSVNKPSVTLDEVGNAIIRAGASLSMQMKKAGPGVITATYSPRGTSATMEIKYDTKQYSILYKDSHGLNYDGRQIHRIYNSWVQNLEDRIRAQLSTL